MWIAGQSAVRRIAGAAPLAYADHMREEHRQDETAFYARCAEILGVEHEYRPWTGRGPNRWNNRKPGNGRFPGRGTVRYFAPDAIHVCLHSPRPVNRLARSSAEAHALLIAAVAAQGEPGAGEASGPPAST